MLSTSSPCRSKNKHLILYQTMKSRLWWTRCRPRVAHRVKKKFRRWSLMWLLCSLSPRKLRQGHHDEMRLSSALRKSRSNQMSCNIKPLISCLHRSAAVLKRQCRMSWTWCSFWVKTTAQSRQKCLQCCTWLIRSIETWTWSGLILNACRLCSRRGGQTVRSCFDGNRTRLN